MPIADFIHLKVRSAYSLTEGANKVDTIVSLAKDQGMPAVAVTDRNNLFGALEFSLYASKAGVQPIVGCDLGIRREEEGGIAVASKLPAIDWLTLLVQSETGYLNLMRLVSRAHLEFKTGSVSALGFGELEGATDGLLAITGSSGSGIGRLLAAGQTPAAAHMLERLQRLFDGRLYLELQRHGEEIERRIEGPLVDLAYERGLPLVATNDVHFPKASMYEAHDVLLCIEQGAHIEDPNRRRLTPEHYFKPAAAMRELFSDLPEACDNTLVIAQRCAYMPAPRKPILPSYTKLKGRSEGEALRDLAKNGLVELKQASRLAENITFERYTERLTYELDMIEKMGFAGYFLIVADFIQWAKDNDVPVGPGRGSGAGSLVAWSLKITDLDPLRWGLLFERFLNPERVSMPDFDIDFCQDKRDRVIRYVRNEYGHDRVAAIITFGKLQARAVLRDVGRVLGMPYGQVDRICKLVPNNPANPVTLAKALETEQLLKEQYSADEEIKRLIDLALQLEGLYRNASTHAAGVVIGDRPLDKLVPLYRDTDNKDSLPATQFNMKWVETAGLVKFDFLGLKTLTVIEKACDLIGRDKINVAKLPLDDRKSFELLARGDGSGVFQLEGNGMREVLRKLKPDRFEDIIAVVALYRPGPMENIPSYIKRKHGEEEPDYLHPLLEGILKETYGIMIYQEQVMQAAQVLSGYTLGGADLLRRAMGKKIKEEMDAQRASFIAGAEKNGVAKDKAASIFDQVDKFAGYGFNKSHAAAYALVCYQTAYLKANHPVEFFAATMTLDMGNVEKLNGYRRDLDRIGVELLPPDVNRSSAEFAVEQGVDGKKAIRYALAAVKGVGREAMNRLTEERQENGPYKDLFDFAERLDQRVINKRLVESLVRAGAFDSLNKNRAQTFGAVEALTRHSQATHESRGSDQNSLFGDDTAQRRPQLPKVPDWAPMERLQQEFGAIGFYLSSHPLAAYERSLQRLGVCRAADLPAMIARGAPGRIRLAGTVIDRMERTSAKGNRFAFVQCSDQSGAFELMVFSELLGSKRNLLEAGQAVLISADGRLDGEQVKLTAQTVEKLDDAVANAAAGLRIMISDPVALEALRKALDGKRGRGRVTLIVPMADDSEAEVTLPGTYSIAGGLRDTIGSLPGVAQVEEI
ncbi:MAG: DNA polymerase III subunit alpha [Reyranella sp.]|uniref:DNA polymerase III subunit alpha n=1 Tax=Reyranella sp. TaxID=1929291 RepID=UPI0009608CF8|nr:DNA polymerase III subunit alpha [Reyranella sp.]MBR2816965.1 DNA polymerase III subunit alpha [Reyranella sp.]OJU46635.1 MAG: DNA polymerase III subunit alpha [Alphaproteobacteria bacterium 65-37]